MHPRVEEHYHLHHFYHTDRCCRLRARLRRRFQGALAELCLTRFLLRSLARWGAQSTETEGPEQGQQLKLWVCGPCQGASAGVHAGCELTRRASHPAFSFFGVKTDMRELEGVLVVVVVVISGVRSSSLLKGIV